MRQFAVCPIEIGEFLSQPVGDKTRAGICSVVERAKLTKWQFEIF
jgi:hypothetical protein